MAVGAGELQAVRRTSEKLDMGSFWLLTALVIAANGLIFRSRAERLGREHPTLRDGYLRLANGFMVWLIAPTLLIAVGVFAGWSTKFAAAPGQTATSSFFDYFCAFVMLGIVIRSAIWIMFQQGAAFLAAHRDVLQPPFIPSSPTGVKIAWMFFAVLWLTAWYFQIFRS